MELRKATEECTVTLTSRRVSITEDTRIGQGAMSRTCSFPTEEKERLGSLHASTSSSTSSFVSPRAPGPPPATVPGPLFITTSQCPAARRANTTGHCVIRKKKKDPESAAVGQRASSKPAHHATLPHATAMRPRAAPPPRKAGIASGGSTRGGGAVRAGCAAGVRDRGGVARPRGCHGGKG
jgi:hypothetical protein